MDHTSYIFFCSHTPAKYSDNKQRAVFSQWYKFDFIGKMDALHDVPAAISQHKHLIEGITFCCCEQWMMAMKALLFNDIVSYNKIMASKDPAEIKAFGKTIANFDEDTWMQWAQKFVENGNFLKFSKNNNMKGILLATNNRIIVEAAQYDNKWGIGFTESEALPNINKWGKNLLGKSLMNVRASLKHRTNLL